MERGASQFSSTKTERKVIEKNRRNHMKTLYFKLNSLLPNHASKEPGISLPDQIDEAINYIRSLEAKLKKSEEQKESLMCGKKLYKCTNSSGSSLKPPRLEIYEMGSSLKVALTSGLDNPILIYEIIRILHEEGAEVVNASFSIVGDSILQSVHAQIGVCAFGFGAAKITERLKIFVNGSSSDGEFQPELWDIDICPQTWDF